jgi:hypothetical protein
MAMTRSQFAVLKLAQKRLGLDDDTYRTVLRIHGGVESAKDLKPTGFKAVMQYFADCGFESDWRKRTYGDGRPGMASPKQIDTIRSRWFDFSGHNDEAAFEPLAGAELRRDRASLPYAGKSRSHVNRS